MKSLGKIRDIVMVGCVAAGLYIMNLGSNILQWHNKEHIDGNYHSVSKSDGAFGHTRYVRYYNGDYKMDEVWQSRFLRTSRFIRDGGLEGENDGLVDEIHIMGIGAKTKALLHRDKDYDANREEFDKADRLLAETKERFEEY